MAAREIVAMCAKSGVLLAPKMRILLLLPLLLRPGPWLQSLQV